MLTIILMNRLNNNHGFLSSTIQFEGVPAPLTYPSSALSTTYVSMSPVLMLHYKWKGPACKVSLMGKSSLNVICSDCKVQFIELDVF